MTSLVHGWCDPEFEPLRALMREFIESGEELGASIAVIRDGKTILDIWGGYADEARTSTWSENTICNVYSTTKTIASLAILMLVDRGILDVDANVSKYWSEFVSNGKEDIKVRHIISHTSGVAGWDEKMTVEDICDFPEAVRKLEKQSPWWTPGTASGYHALTMGFLVGELVRRTTGKTLKQFVKEEISEPLKADFQIGLSDDALARVSDIVPYPPPSAAPKMNHDSITWKVMANPALDPKVANSKIWRTADLGAGNGHGNARSVARILSSITNEGSVDGIQLLSQSTIGRIFEEQAMGIDLVIGVPIRLGTGFGISGNGGTIVDGLMPHGRVCFWGGWGGSIAIMDLDRNVTITYVMNKMDNAGLGTNRCKTYVKAVYDALERTGAKDMIF